MRVAIFGTGYVGLVTGTCLADVGHQVVCVDIDQAKVDGLNQGIIPIYEPGLEPMVKANHAATRLAFTTDAAAAIDHGQVVFIAVGTPPDEDGSADLQYVLAVARTIGRHMSVPTVVVNKSTVPVGTADKVRAAIAEELATRGADIAFDVVSNPEFLKEGDAVADCMRPDRIIIGEVRGAEAVAEHLRTDALERLLDGLPAAAVAVRGRTSRGLRLRRHPGSRRLARKPRVAALQLTELGPQLFERVVVVVVLVTVVVGVVAVVVGVVVLELVVGRRRVAAAVAHDD